MALTERDMEIVKFAAKEAAQEVLVESAPNQRMMAREKAWGVSKEAIASHVENCKVPGQVKMGFMKMIIFGLICGSGGGLVSRIPDILEAIKTAFH